MTVKTRAELLVKELEKRQHEITGEAPGKRTVKQSDSAGIDKLEKRRAALRKLHDFRNGVLS